jgi:lipoprotein-anchoring transpeptidase ErfK/SrfK
MFKSLIAAIALAVTTSLVAPVGASAAVEEKKSIVSFLSSKNKKKVVTKKTVREKVKVVRKANERSKPLTTASIADQKPRRTTTRRDCGSFTECLFGSRPERRQRVQTASLGRSNISIFRNSGTSGRTARQSVAWTSTKYPVGSIIVKTPERALYYVTGPGTALRYSVGVGREGFQWSGDNRISRKAEWPSWTPPQEMIEREAEKGITIPDFMEGGPGNPLGARALYIGGTIYRIHGTNNEASIGGAVSSGCIRMMNADVIDLHSRVKVGARIYVYQ